MQFSRTTIGLIVLTILAIPLATNSAFAGSSLDPNGGPAALDGTGNLKQLEKEQGRENLLRSYEAATRSLPAHKPLPKDAQAGDKFNIIVWDDLIGFYPEDFVVVGSSDHAIVCIEKAAYDAYDGSSYWFPNPNGDTPDPNDWWNIGVHELRDTQVQFILDEFDKTMWPTCTGVFGKPASRGEEGQKTWVLIHNIRDTWYYDPTQPFYIAGYFWNIESDGNQKNIIHIDSYQTDFENRINPAATGYLGTVAHEFQHMIHNDQDPFEEIWLNEGCSDLAIYLCDYGHPLSHINYFLKYHPWTPLTVFNNALEDYGAAYLFTLYLYEKYGGADFISALVRHDGTGIEGIEDVLDDFGYRTSFRKIFDDWAIAIYADDDKKCGGKYGFDNLDIGPDTNGVTIEGLLAEDHPVFGPATWGPPDEAPLLTGSDAYYVDPTAWTVRYYRFRSDQPAEVLFEGDPESGVAAASGTWQWYSGNGAWAWNGMSRKVAVPATGTTTLTFQAWYDIEDGWDYGYVEVYDGSNWVTLPDKNGLTSSAVPSFGQYNTMLPPGREPMEYFLNGAWNGLTGSSGGWVTVEMDLTSFAGKTIELHFRTWQDGAFSGRMLFVDDIAIKGTGLDFFDDVESGGGDWTLDGFVRTEDRNKNDYSVQVFEMNAHHEGLKLHHVKGVEIDDKLGIGGRKVPATPEESGRWHVIVVSNQVGHMVAADYLISVLDDEMKVGTKKMGKTGSHQLNSMRKGVQGNAQTPVAPAPPAPAVADAGTRASGSSAVSAGDTSARDDPSVAKGDGSSKKSDDGEKESGDESSGKKDSGDDSAGAKDAKDSPDESAASSLSGKAGEKAGKTEGGTMPAGKDKPDGPKSGFEDADAEFGAAGHDAI